jgi:hypothetical protein
MRATRRAFFVLTCVTVLTLFAHTRASAQEEAQLTGVVKDASGAVLPGVTVEASSPVLIEKVRTAVTDGAGQYRIANLRPGTYEVTFTLTGFQTLKRDAIEVTGRGVFTVNADMKVGTVQETVTVTSEAPVVDTQSVRRQTAISGETVNAIPTAHSYASLLSLMPGVTTSTGDVTTTPGLMLFGGAGGRPQEGRVMVDGLLVGAAINGGGASGYVTDIVGAAEVVTTNSGNLGEQEVGGPTLTIVPKTGGNTFKGTIYGGGFNSSTVSSNYTDDLKNRGLTSASTIDRLWDLTAGVGGPIKKDRLWFYGNYRDEGEWAPIAGLFANANFENITAPHTPNSAVPWRYVPDTNLPAYTANSFLIGGLRLTTQLTPRNKLSLFWDEQRPCDGSSWLQNTNDACRNPSNGKAFVYIFGVPSNTSPEAAGYLHRLQRVQQASWNSPVSNNLLLEVAGGTQLTRWDTNRRPDSVTEDIIPVVELCSFGCLNNGNHPNLAYRSESPNDNWIGQFNWRASASYVTGAHSFKAGYQGIYDQDDRQGASNSTYTSYNLQNGSAAGPGASITETVNTFVNRQRVHSEAAFVQDQWTHGRFTLQGAVRYDYVDSFFPDQTVGGVPFLPTPVTFAQNDPLLTTPSTLLCSSDLKGGNLPAGFNGMCSNNVWGYKDITPRGGVAWDVLGTGRTAVKISMGKYLEAASSGNGNYTIGNPTTRMTTSATRTWTDANGNYVPDCNLSNPALQDNRSSGGDFCAAVNPNFGKALFTNSFDYNNMGGWGVRPNDWLFVASVQQQVQAQTSVEIAYTRRWLNNFTVVDNLLTTSADYARYSVLAPTTPLLPGSVSGQLIPGFYNVNQTLQNGMSNTAANTFATNANNYGNAYVHYDGVQLNATSRLRNGLTLQGGLTTGRSVSDDCAMLAAVPEVTVGRSSLALVQPGIPAVNATGGASPVSAANPYCHVDPGLITRVTGLGTYIIPKVDVLVSGTFRSDQGSPLAANYTVPATTTNAALTGQIVGLGRSLSNGATTTTVNLLAPGTLWSDRINELDFKVAKVLHFGRSRTNVGVEVYNALNKSSVLTYNQTLSINPATGQSSYLVPLTIMTPRFVKFSAQFDF